MRTEADEIQISYFVLCDQIIVEAQTGKRSLIGIYSGLMIDQLPVQANLAVAFGARVQTARPRDFRLHFTGPDGDSILATPPMPYDWDSLAASLEQMNFTTLQMGINIAGVPFNRPGVYTATLLCDGDLLATYPLAVSLRA